MTANNLPKRTGTSLIEMCVVMALIVVLLSITTVALWSTIRIERTEAAAFRKTSQQSNLADQFREDVGNATAAPDKFADQVVGPDRLILAQPGGKHVVYAWLGKQVERTELGAEQTTKYSMPIGEDLKVEFTRGDVGLLIMRFFDVRKGMSLQSPVEFAAALGGNLK